jgi:hypothetical protein
MPRPKDKKSPNESQVTNGLVSRFMVLFVLVFCLALLSTGAARTLFTTTKTPEPAVADRLPDSKLAHYKAPQEQRPPISINQEPTPVEAEKMNEKQRVHSSFYNGLGLGRKLKDIPTTDKDRQEDLDLNIVRGPGTPFSSGNSDLMSSLQRAVVGADSIVVGTVKNKSSQLSEDETFIFTDYAMSINEVLKTTSQSQVQPQSNILVTAPGGKIRLAGRVIQAVDQSLWPLEVGGRYVLFLQYIPATGAYRIVSPEASAQIRTGKAVMLAEIGSSNPDGKDEQSFIDEILAILRNK